MKVGDLIKLRDGSIGLVVVMGFSKIQDVPYFQIHTGERFFPDCQKIDGWKAV